MRLTINFGLIGIKKQVTWYKDVLDFPKLINFQGEPWEWVLYNQIGNDYELTFGQIPNYDPDYYVSKPSFEDMFGLGNEGCECGAIYSSFEWDHLRYCPKHKRWDKL